MDLQIAPRRRDEPPDDDEENILLTRERLEQLATHHTAAPMPALAERWSFTPEEIRAVQSIDADSRSDNTDRSYATAARYWQAWFLLRYRRPLTLPVSPEAILRFIIDHVAHWPDATRPDFEVYLLPGWIEAQLVDLGLKRVGAWKPNTIEHRVSVLSSMHDNTRDANGDPFVNPCRDRYVGTLLRRVRKAHAKHGRVEIRRDAATKDVLTKLLAQRGGDSLRHLRDRAILLVGFNTGGRRRSEIAALTREKLVSDGDGFLWKLGQTKNSDGKDVDIQKPIQGPAAAALKQWLAASGIEQGPVFREIVGMNELSERPMSAQAVYRLVKSAAKKAGLDGAWGAHSLRGGFMTQAGKDGHSLNEAMRLSDHKSVVVADRYYQTGSASTSPAANLADGIELPMAPAAATSPATKARSTSAKQAATKKADATERTAPPVQRCFQLRVQLQHVSPPVWRIVWIPASSTFDELHWVLAAALGWGGEHLYRFDVDGLSVMSPHASLDAEARADRVRLASHLADRSRFGYAYDFGDDWYHDVEVLDDDPECDLEVPRCQAGSGACPPEDVGGPGGYEIFKRQAKARRGDLYRWHREQGGSKGWNPMIFSVSAANKAIERVRKGILP